MAEVKHVNDTTFETEVMKASGPVLVDFWAPWCGPCRMLAPVIDSLATKYEGKLKVCKVNTDESPATPGKYDIHGIPTLIVFKDGAEVQRHVGYAPESQLAGMIDGVLS
jgi:thioredoxin 1